MDFRAYRMRVKKEKIKDYVEIHKKTKIWKEIIEDMVKAGFTKMIILQFGQDIIIFEEAGDLKKAYQLQSKSEANKKWDELIGGWMESYPDFSEDSGDIEFEEVPIAFYFENGKLLH